MRKANELVGLPVLAFDTGVKIGEVKDTLFGPEHLKILAFLVDEGGWFEEARVIPFESVQSIGRDAVIVPGQMIEVKVSQNPTIKAAFDSRRTVTGMRAYSEDGRHLGTIEDVIFDETNGRVHGYEISGGFLDKIMKGKHFMPAPDAFRVGKEFVFVPSETATRMEEEATGGLARRLEEAKQAGATYLGEAREAVSGARERMSALSSEQQKRFAIGRTVRSEVRLPDGTVLAMPAQTVTPEMADKAEQQSILGSLLAAVGGAEAESLLTRLQAEATRAYHEARKMVTGTSEKAQEEMERRRIEDALGRPVTRVILDDDDRVVLNTGEIVTNAAIKRAREAGVLTMLLNSVSHGEPRLGFEQQKAPAPGEERLEEHPQARA